MPLKNGLLASLNAEFDAVYAHTGRPSIRPERLPEALLFQVLYTVCSERLLVEQLEYKLLFRWFVGLEADEAVWERSIHKPGATLAGYNGYDTAEFVDFLKRRGSRRTLPARTRAARWMAARREARAMP